MKIQGLAADHTGRHAAMMIFLGHPSSKVIASGADSRKNSPASGLAARRHPGCNAPRAMSDTTIHTHGRILEILGPVLYRVALPNGKTLLAHLSKRMVGENTVFPADGRVLLEFTPYDFDTARILGPAE